MNRNEFLRALAAAALSTWALPNGARAQRPADRKMHTRPIPASGAPLPVVGCGTWRTFDVGQGASERSPLREVLQILFDHGGSVIDSSPMYGRAEGVVGDLLTAMSANGRPEGEHRSAQHEGRPVKAHAMAFIATKVWTQGQQAGIAQMQRSMQLLQSARIDLMQVHNLVDWRAHLATLRAWKAEGRVRYVGVTHYTSSAYGELESVMRSARPDFVQLNYALDDREAEKRLLPLAADLGVAVIVNQPFGGGGLLRSLADKPLPRWASDLECETWAEVLLKFVLAHPAVTCVIPGTGRPEHMRSNVRAGFGRYPDADLRATMIASLPR